MDSEKLKTLFFEVMTDMDKVHIPYSKNFQIRPNFRAVRRRGACKKEKGHFVIELSYDCLNGPENEIKDVIAHELIHTCEGCFNHGAQFKKYMQIINTLGYNVSVTYKGDADELEKYAKYKIVCRDCGTATYRMRTSNLVKYPSKYKCAKCGGKLDVYIRTWLCGKVVTGL